MDTRIKTTLGFLTLTFCAALAGCAPDGTPTDEMSLDDVAEVQQPLSCTAPACGTAMAWLDGEPARSNGPNQGSGVGCAPNGQYGIQYQCVEFARRYWAKKKNILLPQPLISWDRTNACELCNVPPNGWVRYTAPLPTPAKGDLFVKPCVSGSVGHVGVVESAANGQVTVVEQNYSCTGRSTYPLSQASCLLRPIPSCAPNCS